MTRVEDGLIKLNVGSDRGLEGRAHARKCFRLSNVPNESVRLSGHHAHAIMKEVSILTRGRRPDDVEALRSRFGWAMKVAQTTSVVR